MSLKLSAKEQRAVLDNTAETLEHILHDWHAQLDVKYIALFKMAIQLLRHPPKRRSNPVRG
jgi:hypothetical protein